MRSLAFLLAVFVVCIPAFGQSDRGTVTGTVADPAGAVVAGAPVEARNVETGEPGDGQTDPTRRRVTILVTP